MGTNTSKPRRIGDLEVDNSQPWAFFHGASQDRPRIQGAERVIYLSCAHRISFRGGLGKAQIIKAEWKALTIL